MGRVRFNVSVTSSSEPEFRAEELALLRDAETGDVSFDWVLIHLGLRANPPEEPAARPGAHEIDTAFEVLSRLLELGLVEVGQMEYMDGGPPGRIAPVHHVAEPLDVVKERVTRAATQLGDWEHSCWVVATQHSAH